MRGLSAGILRCEVEGDHLGAACRNLGFNHSEVLAILVNLLTSEEEVQLAAESVLAIILDGDVALLGGTYLLTTCEFKVGRLEIYNGMVGKGYPVAVEGGFNVIAVTLNHGFPHIATGNRADRLNLVGAASDVFAKGIGHRTLVLGPSVGNGDEARTIVGLGNQLNKIVFVVIQGDAAQVLGAIVDMVLGGHLDVATLGELEVAVIAALKLARARVVHIPYGQAVVNHFLMAAVTRFDADNGGLVNVVTLHAVGGSHTTGIGIEHRQDEVTVTDAAPAPVDVEQVAVGIAVADE